MTLRAAYVRGVKYQALWDRVLSMGII